MASLEQLKKRYAKENAVFFKGTFKDAVTGDESEDYIAITLDGSIDFTALLQRYSVKGFSVAGSNFVSEQSGRVKEIKAHIQSIINMGKNFAPVLEPAEVKTVEKMDEIESRLGKKGKKTEVKNDQ